MIHKNQFRVALPMNVNENSTLLQSQATLQDLIKNRNFLVMRSFWTIFWMFLLDVVIVVTQILLRDRLGLNAFNMYAYVSWFPSLFGIVRNSVFTNV